jgi:hypothetical protein
MGAWLSCGGAGRLDAKLLASLETSQGMLTAPPLAMSIVQRHHRPASTHAGSRNQSSSQRHRAGLDRFQC